MAAERERCAFDTDALCARIYDDANLVRRRREILAFVESEPELANVKTDTSFMSRMEALGNAAHNTTLLWKYKERACDVNSPMELAYFRRQVE